jgi:hypothetical protein
MTDIRLLEKCSNLKSSHLCLTDGNNQEILKKLLSLKVKMLKIELVGSYETNILNINNDKLKILSIVATNHNKFIPKEIFDLKLKSLKIEGPCTLEKTNYFPNLFRYENIFISNNETIFNCLVNGDHEMFLDLTHNVKSKVDLHKKLFVDVDKNFIIPDSITALNIKIPMIMSDREIQLKIITLKIMSNLPLNIHLYFAKPTANILNNLPLIKKCAIVLSNLSEEITNLPTSIKELILIYLETDNILVDKNKKYIIKIPFDCRLSTIKLKEYTKHHNNYVHEQICPVY